MSVCVCVYKCANGKVNHHRGGAAAVAAALMIKSWQCEHYHWSSMNKQIHDAWPAKRAERSRGTIGKRREKELWIKEISELICTCCRPVAAAAAARTFALPFAARTVINRPELWSLKLNGVLKQTQAHKQAHRIRSSFVVNSTGKTNCHRCVQSVELCGNCWLAFAAAAAMKVQYDWSLESVTVYTQASSRAQSAELKLRRLFHNTTNHRLEAPAAAAVTVFRLIVEHTVSALFDYISVWSPSFSSSSLTKL